MRDTLCIIVMAMCLLGCQSVTEATRSESSAQASPAARNSAVTVKLFKLPGITVPIQPEGATVRSVLSAAQDSSGFGESLQYAINDKEFVNSIGIPFDEQEQAGSVHGLSQAGKSVVFIAGRNHLMFIPIELISDTVAGRIRVLPGDIVGTLIDREAFVRSVDANNTAGTIRVTSPFFEPFNAGSGNLVTVIAKDENRSVLSDPKGPFCNVAVVRRTIVGVVQTFLIPVENSFGREDRSQLSAGTERDLMLLDGDEIHFTRIELVPEIAEAMISPPPPLASTALNQEVPARRVMCHQTDKSCSPLAFLNAWR